MSVGEVLPEPLATGVITEREMSWIAAHLGSFTQHEEASGVASGPPDQCGSGESGLQDPRPRHPA